MSNWCRVIWGATLAGVCGVTAAAPLTADEARWLQAAAPVRAYALEQGLPLDVVVQPQDAPGYAPLAMAYVGGRCKLVLSMRGNPAVQEALAGVDADFAALAIETMAAHELGHCWRYVRGDWHAWPVGFSAPPGDAAEASDDAAPRAAMAATRREEGFADLVALAYVQRQHPAAYGSVQRWLAAVRDDQPVAGAHHDTRLWVRLAADPATWRGTGGSVFEQAAGVWRLGLAAL